MHQSGMEHRCGRRRPIDMEVRLIGVPGAIGVGRMRDLSATGAFVQTLLELPVLAPVYVEPIEPHAHVLETRTVAAFVVRGTATGLGLEWSEFSPAILNQWPSIGRLELLTASRPGI
jgi:hypothetical protein